MRLHNREWFSQGKFGGRKRLFNLLELAYSEPENLGCMDEVSRYSLLDLNHLNSERERFISDHFSAFASAQ